MALLSVVIARREDAAMILPFGNRYADHTLHDPHDRGMPDRCGRAFLPGNPKCHQ
jgi:hypothetical protein